MACLHLHMIPCCLSFSRALCFLPGARSMLCFQPCALDLYGKKFASANYGLLYTAKGMAALVVPLANLLPAGPGSWKIVFMFAAALDLAAALLALFVLKPLRKTVSNARG